MNNEKSDFLSFLLFFAILSTLLAAAASFGIKKSDFPSGFVFGAGTSALQVEGVALEDGRKESIWEPYTHSGMTTDKCNGDISADRYHKYKEDVKLMHDLGLDAYRFSISWPRLIPERISLLTRMYASKNFGDRVKNWITVNEPNLEPIGGYDDGSFPPQRCSSPFGVFNCSKGDSTKEPYIVAHNRLLLHLSASVLYKEKYKAIQGGIIGITIAAFWFESFTNLQEDIAAKNRMLDFHIGWL